MNFILAIIIITGMSVLVDWLFFSTSMADLLVNQYMRKELWRKTPPGLDEEQQQLNQMGSKFLVSTMFAVLFVIFWSVFQPVAPVWVLSILAWFAILIPFIISESIYLDLHPRYMAQRAIAWLVRLGVAGVIVDTIF